jgi:hypothetical protein
LRRPFPQHHTFTTRTISTTLPYDGLGNGFS